MKWLSIVACLLLSKAGLAQQLPPKKQSDSLRNQDNMPVLRNRGGSTMPVLKERGNALPMPNSYTPLSESDEQAKALDALPDQINRFKADSSLRRNQRTPPVPKKGK